MDIAAFSHHHQSGSALVQPVHRMEDKRRTPVSGQGTGYGRGIRQKVGGMGRHTCGLVYHQQVTVFPQNGKRPVSGNNSGLWRTVVSGFHGQNIPGVENIHRPGMTAIDKNTALCPG